LFFSAVNVLSFLASWDPPVSLFFFLVVSSSLLLFSPQFVFPSDGFMLDLSLFFSWTVPDLSGRFNFSARRLPRG